MLVLIELLHGIIQGFRFPIKMAFHPKRDIPPPFGAGKASSWPLSTYLDQNDGTFPSYRKRFNQWLGPPSDFDLLQIKFPLK